MSNGCGALDAVDVGEPRSRGAGAGPADHGGASLGQREQVEPTTGELGAEIDGRPGVEWFLVVVGHDDPHGVVPVELVADLREQRVGVAVALQRGVAVGSVHVRGGVGRVELADDQVRSAGDGADELDDRVAVVDVTVRVAPRVGRRYAVGGPVQVGRTGSHHSDEALVAEHRGARAAGGPAGVEEGRDRGAELPGRRQPTGLRHPVGDDAVRPRRHAGDEGRVVGVGGRGHDRTGAARRRTSRARARPTRACARGRRGATAARRPT